VDALLGTVTAITKSLVENSDLKKEIYESKDKYSLAFTYTPSMAQTVSKIMEAYNINEADGHTKPMINILTQSIKTLDTIFKEIADRAKEAETTELLETYKELSETFTKMVDALTKVNQK
jgi:hypothetical protein